MGNGSLMLTQYSPVGALSAAPWVVARILVIGMTVVGACAPAVDAPARPVAPAEALRPVRVVAVGDLHGDLGATREVLAMAGVLGEGDRWTGGETVLVQTGDVLDRGDEGRQVLDLLRSLAAQAEAAGGRAVMLVGNHEAMNVLGDWRYVSPGDVAAYGGEEARREALSRDGVHGSWIVGSPAAVQVGDTVFVHGGISASLAALGLDALNDGVRAALRREGIPSFLDDRGPLWYRGYLEGREPDVCIEAREALGTLGAARMVMGHTTRPDGRIAVRCGGALVAIDTGISSARGKHVAALELVGRDARALYPGEMVDLPDP